jgi:TorA maturation chaperone TorD
MTADVVTREESIELAEQRSQVYAFLSRLYTVLPDRAFVERLTDGQMDVLLDALSAQELPDEIQTGIHLLKEYLASIRTAPLDQVETDLAVERARLLRGIKPGYGPPPPYESVYRGTAGMDAGQTLLEVKRAYAAAGVRLPAGEHEPVDYIGFELDLMHYLVSQEAEARRANDTDQARRWIDQQRAFLREHLAAWVPQFCDLMAEQAALGFYQGAARITKGFVLSEHERTDVRTH